MCAVWVRCRAEASYSQGGCAHLRVVDVFRRFRHGRNGLRVPEGVRHMLLRAAKPLFGGGGRAVGWTL